MAGEDAQTVIKGTIAAMDGGEPRPAAITFVSTEHTAYTKNGCIDRAVDGYLFTGSLPRAGTRCRR